MFSFAGKLNVYIRRTANIKIDLAVGKRCVVIKAYAYVSCRTSDFILRRITELHYQNFQYKKTCINFSNIKVMSKKIVYEQNFLRRKINIARKDFLNCSHLNRIYSQHFLNFTA